MFRTLLLALLVAAPAWADGFIRISDVNVSGSRSSLRFEIRITHPGWEWDGHLDSWRVVGPDGTVYGQGEAWDISRFGGSLCPEGRRCRISKTVVLERVSIPAGIDTVTVEARAGNGAWGSGVQVELPSSRW